MKALAIAGSLAALTACATPPVSTHYGTPLMRSGATIREFKMDRKACVRAAMDASDPRPSASAYFICMAAKGWVKQDGGFVPTNVIPMKP